MENSHFIERKSINPFKINFPFLCPLKTKSMSGGTERNESNCIKRRKILLAYKNTDKNNKSKTELAMLPQKQIISEKNK